MVLTPHKIGNLIAEVLKQLLLIIFLQFGRTFLIAENLCNHKSIDSTVLNSNTDFFIVGGQDISTVAGGIHQSFVSKFQTGGVCQVFTNYPKLYIFFRTSV